MDADGPDAAHIPVSFIRNLVGTEETVLLDQPCRLRTLDRDQIDTHRGGEVDDRTLRPAAHAEEGVDRAVLETVGHPLSRQILRLEIPLAETGNGKDQPP